MYLMEKINLWTNIKPYLGNEDLSKGGKTTFPKILKASEEYFLTF